MTLSEALAHDTIRIALKTAGYSNVDSMDQFARASAMLDMAQEFVALTNQHQCDASCSTCQDSMCGNYKANADNVCKVEVWERLYVRSWERTLGEMV